jgi:hypothetical protein
MSPWRLLVPLAAVACVAVATLAAGMTNSYGTGARADTDVVGWISDGAATDTFWDSPIVDLPGVSLYQIHCHGQMRLDFQVGATGPPHSNPCYAAMNEFSGTSSEVDTYVMLGGGKALYRRSDNYGPWSYYVGDVISGTPPGEAGPP